MSSKRNNANRRNNGLIRSIAWWCAVGSTVLLSLCSLATFVHPARFPFIGVYVLSYPILLLISVLAILTALVLRVRRWWIALLILLCNVWTIRIYIPVNLPPKEPEAGLRVLSFNVQNFFATKSDPQGEDTLSHYLARSGADILCLQEAPRHDKRYFNRIWPVLREAFPYRDSLEMKSSSFLDIYSRLPIIGKELVADGGSNHCMAWTLLDGKDTLYVVNCHLRSTLLSPEDKANFSGIVHDADTLSAGEKKRSSVMLLTKIAAASVERANQVDQLCRYLERQKGKRIILCGDFNDTPISYAHNRISAYLKDCYAATATGFGRSFNRNSMLVRIDHMFCSEHYQPHNCRIDQGILLSDHYPISCTFTAKE